MDTTRPRIGIGLPLVALKSRPLVSLCSTLCTASTVADMALLVTEGAYIPYNRILLVQLAREEGCSHLFFMDHDVVYPNNTVQTLLAHDKDVVACHYNMKSDTPRMGMAFDPQTGARLPVTEQGELSEKMLFEVGGIGCGCMLVKMSVFDKLETPWFNVQLEGEEIVRSEDLWFCDKVRRAGFSVWCDPTIRVWHMGEKAY